MDLGEAIYWMISEGSRTEKHQQVTTLGPNAWESQREVKGGREGW